VKQQFFNAQVVILTSIDNYLQILASVLVVILKINCNYVKNVIILVLLVYLNMISALNAKKMLIGKIKYKKIIVVLAYKDTMNMNNLMK